MKEKYISVIPFILITSGLFQICLPAFAEAGVQMYKYLISTGIITISMGIILPELLRHTKQSRHKAA